MTKPSDSGPVEAFQFPTKLQARVVQPGSAPRIGGYDVQADLARHYRFTDVLFLAATGELPDADTSRLVELALWFMAPSPVSEAPAHAALLARLCGATDGAVVTIASMTLAEQAAHFVAKHQAWLSWLANPEGRPPAGYEAATTGEREAVARLIGLAQGAAIVGLTPAGSLGAALVAVLVHCGLDTPARLTTAWVFARLPAVAAEALAGTPASFRDYPMNLPAFRYEDDHG